MSESIPLQVPLKGLQMDSDTAQYVGMLEGTIAALVINEVKYRTLLELLTGDYWEAATVNMDPNALVPLAVSALVKQTNLDENKAKKLISARWDDHNNKTNPVVPQAVSTRTANYGSRPDHVVTQPMSERLKSWRERQEQESEASSHVNLTDESVTPNSE